MTEVRRLSTALALALVALRFCTGLHFYSEGTKKLSYNSGTGELTVNFSAEGFLKQAVGPLAGFFRGMVPSFYDWQQTLVQPREAGAAADDDQPPYAAWEERIEAGFRQQQEAFGKLSGITDEQRTASAERLEFRVQQLKDYLDGQAGDIAEYQHELWRLRQWEARPEAEGAPFQQERIAEKQAELGAQPLAWVKQAEGIERGFHDDLRALLTPEQEQAGLAEKAVRSLSNPQAIALNWMNVFITCVITAIGVCLMFGLLTRLAALGGAGFLLMVMATQPPWVEGAVTTMFFYQLVEVVALLVLCVAGAGQWAGLDALLRRWLFGANETR